jgi:hypothetical protein
LCWRRETRRRPGYARLLWYPTTHAIALTGSSALLPLDDMIHAHVCPSANASSSALASCKSAVSNPSVNQA